MAAIKYKVELTEAERNPVSMRCPSEARRQCAP